MLRLLLIFFFVSIIHLQIFSQINHKSAGIRLGHTSGITYKTFINPEVAFEFILSGRKEGIQITTLLIDHNPIDISFNEKFTFYYGIGVHTGIERFGDYRLELIEENELTFTRRMDVNYFTMGVNGLIGIEYRLSSLPLTFGLDLKPYFNFIGLRHTNFRFWDLGLSIKYFF